MKELNLHCDVTDTDVLLVGGDDDGVYLRTRNARHTGPLVILSWKDTIRDDSQACPRSVRPSDRARGESMTDSPELRALKGEAKIAELTGKMNAATSTTHIALPADSDARKAIPLASGLLAYFPAALCAVAEVSRVGNAKHNPGQSIHWSRGKSDDHADALLRHLVDHLTGEESYTETVEGKSVEVLHAAAVAWRALALLQLLCEKRGAKVAPAVRAVTPRELAVGARVRLLRAALPSGAHTVRGCEGRVQRFDGDAAFVAFDNGEAWWILPKHLEVL